MARRGTKPIPDAQKVLRGTFQPSRSHPPAVLPVPGEVVAPKWLKGSALNIWHEKVEIYVRRGQQIRGCESSLAQYCQIEADLINRWKKQIDVPVALLNAHRIYANEFYDTPASQQGVRGGAEPSNRFARNGRPAATA